MGRTPARRRRAAAPRAWLPVIGCLALAGCAINPRIDLSDYQRDGRSGAALEMPFFPQTENQCGPAALATVLTQSGIEMSPAALTPQVYLPAREGSLQVELMAAARRAGRIPFTLEPRVEALLAELDAGRGVLLLQNLRTPHYPAWHYAVLTGYDPGRNAFRLNSGTQQAVWQPAPQVLRTWNWGGDWAMVTLVPGELPAMTFGAQEEAESARRFFRALADFEAVAGGAAARPAWLAAEMRWPDRPEPALALGNLAYQKARLDEAVEWYGIGLRLQPENPALANNLASVLGEAGCPRAGESVLRPLAVKLENPSPWAEPIGRTLSELAARAGEDPAFCGDYRVRPTPRGVTRSPN